MMATRRTTKPLPRNSYELMERAIENMEREPETYLQERYCVIDRSTLRELWGRERCNTAYCRAGHIVAAAGFEVKENTPISYVATNLLGNPSDIGSLFSGGALAYKDGIGWKAYKNALPEIIIYKDNPREYLRRGISGMKLFMKKHEQALRVHKLELPLTEDELIYRG